MLEKIIATIKHTALAAALATTLAACGGGSPTGPSPGPNPTPVTQTVKVISSDGRDLGTTTYTANQGENLTITINSLKDKGINTDTIDPNYAALRENNNGDQLGNYVTNTTNGTITIPVANSNRILWGMNSTNGTDYGCAWNTGLGRNGLINDRRYATVRKLTASNNTISELNVVDGDATAIENSLAILNGAWLVNGVKQASLTWAGDANNSDIKGGFGNSTFEPNAGGYHIGDSYVVNPSAGVNARGISVAEAIETFTKYDDLCGRDTILSLFNNARDPDITPKGKDYVRFGALMSR